MHNISFNFSIIYAVAFSVYLNRVHIFPLLTVFSKYFSIMLTMYMCMLYCTIGHDLLKKHYSDLVGTIQDPAGLAGSLYSRGIISQTVRDEIQQRDLITKRKNEVLINAVEAQVTTDPSMFQVFMEVLKDEPSLSTIVERMTSLGKYALCLCSLCEIVWSGLWLFSASLCRYRHTCIWNISQHNVMTH